MLYPEVAHLPEDDADVDPWCPRPASGHRTRRRGRLLAGAAAALALVAVGGVTGAWAGATSFKDVPADHPFHSEILWASKHDLAAGYKDGTFHPSDAVSRQAATAFFKRYNASITTHKVAIPFGSKSAYDATASCPAGKVPIGGGGWIGASNLFMTDSHPTATGWYARWESDNDAVIDANGEVSVICKPDNSSS